MRIDNVTLDQEPLKALFLKKKLEICKILFVGQRKGVMAWLWCKQSSRRTCPALCWMSMCMCVYVYII